MTDKRQTVKKDQIYVNAINLHYKTVNIGGKSKIEPLWYGDISLTLKLQY